MHCCNVVAQEGYSVCWVALQRQEGARAVIPLHKGSKGRLDRLEGRSRPDNHSTKALAST